MSSTSESDEDLHPEPGGERSGPSDRWPWMRRAAPLALLAGVALAASLFFKRMPQEREIELRLEDAATIVQVDLTWTEAYSDGDQADGEPVQGSTLRFAAGSAPKSLLTKVRLPDGTYDLEIAIDRTLGRATTRRLVTLEDAARITFPVR